MIYGIMITCMMSFCSPESAVYKKEYGPFSTMYDCGRNANVALHDVPPSLLHNPKYTCYRR